MGQSFNLSDVETIAKAGGQASTGRNAVEVRDICKTYKIYPSQHARALDSLGIHRKHKLFEALKGVTLDFEEGQVHAILGKNGSGKSTLLKIITGVVTPNSGEVRVRGRVSAMLELTSGFSPDLTGIENVYLKALTMGIEKSDIEKRMQDIIEFADIGEHINQPFRTYSSGMRARLGFAVAVNVEPDILIVDEVLAVGDSIFKLKCIDKMAQFRREGKTILFVSHSLATVKAFCTRGVWINKGEVIKQGALGEVVVAYDCFLKEERAKLRQEAREKALVESGQRQRALEKRDLFSAGRLKFLTATPCEEDNVVFGHDEDIAWEFTYVVRSEDAGELSACFSLADAEGFIVEEIDKQRFIVDNSLGEHVGKFTLRNPNLLPGKYVLVGEVWELDSSCVFKYAKGQPFEIELGNYVGTGVVDLEHELEVDGVTVLPHALAGKTAFEQVLEVDVDDIESED